jgi:hypothetical protein
MAKEVYISGYKSGAGNECAAVEVNNECYVVAETFKLDMRRIWTEFTQT